MLQSLVTIQQLLSNNTASALFWRTLFGSPAEVVALAIIVVLLVAVLLKFIADLVKHNILRATLASVLAYVLFIAITLPAFGEDVAKMTGYTVASYIFFMEGVVKDPSFLNYLTLLGGAIAWIAKTVSATAKWVLFQSERAFMFTAKTLAEGLEAARVLSKITAQNIFFLWSRLQEEKTRRNQATRTVAVESEVSE